MATSIAWPADANAANASMQQWRELMLAEARKVDPSASLTNIGTNGSYTGVPALIVGGKEFPLTSVDYNDYTQFGITPQQAFAKKVTGQPLVLTPEQRAKVQQSQISALTSAMAQGGQNPGVPAFVDKLQEFWKTPEGQGIDPNAAPAPVYTLAPPPVAPVLPRVDPVARLTTLGTTDTRAAAPMAATISPYPQLGTAPVANTAQAKMAAPITYEQPNTMNALSPQVAAPVQQTNPQYQQKLRAATNIYRWGRGGQ